MPPRNLSLVAAFLATVVFAACSDQSPVAPGATPDLIGGPSLLSRPVLGTYELSFLPTGSGLGVVLKAHVEDASNNPAQSGTAIFQYCSLQGDPAPSTDCDTGSGSWVHFGMAGFLASGDALLTFDLAPPSGTTIGFRFRYIGQGSGIANGVSAPGDHTF